MAGGLYRCGTLDDLTPGYVNRRICFGRPVISIVRSFSYPNNSNNRVVYLTIRLLTTYDKKSDVYSYEGVPLLVGSYQSLKINGILLRGVVQRVDSGSQRPEKKTFIVEGFVNPENVGNQNPYAANTVTDGVLNYLADEYTKGLKILDSDGSVAAEILEVNEQPAHRKFIYGNQLIETLDSERKKVELKVQITTEKYGDVYLFMGEVPLRVNDNLFLSFWSFETPLTITDVKEE
jgi:hypothetical protein